MKIRNSFFVGFFLSLLVFQTLYSQEKINQFDANGKRTGTWKKLYDNNRIRYQGQFENGKEIGVFKYYSENTSDYPIIIKIFSKENSLAKVQFFTEKGIIESEGEMNGKNRVGKWLFYHVDGKTIISEENYIDGVLNGNSKTYYLSGQITESLYFKNGKLHGNIKRYGSNGVLLDDINYENGKLNGEAKYYNAEGKLMYFGNYENDEKVGDWKYLDAENPENKNKTKQ